MQAYPMQSKIKLLATLDEEKRVNLMNTFLEEGSSGKEMIMMEHYLSILNQHLEQIYQLLWRATHIQMVVVDLDLIINFIMNQKINIQRIRNILTLIEEINNLIIN